MSKSYSNNIFLGVCYGSNTKYYHKRRQLRRRRNKQHLRNAMQFEDIDETTERMLYRMKCKHYIEGSELCALYSQNGNWHFMMKCDGDCNRMKNYDKKINEE